MIKYRTPCKKVKEGKNEYEITREEYAARYNATVPEEPELPEVAEHIWWWFWQLNQRRQKGFDSPNPLSFSEVMAWVNLTNTYILPEEIEAIMAMDSAYLEAVQEEQKVKREDDKK